MQTNKNYIFFNGRMIQLIILLFVLSSIAPIHLYVYDSTNSSILIELITQIGVVILFLSIISIVQRYYHTNKVASVPNLAIIVLFGFLATLLVYAITRTLSDEVEYSRFVRVTIALRGIGILLFYALATSLLWIDRQHVHVQRIQSYAIDKEREAVRIELNSLQQKFKPHFLFNSLNSISALTVSDPDKAREMIHLLSDFMRKAVKEDHEELITLEDEITHLKRYVAIEQIRFGDRLNVIYQIDDSALGHKVPSLILQPVIENAIKYGLYGSLDVVEIGIRISLNEAKLEISVQNPFDSDAQRASAGTGYGLNSIRKKLFLIYGQKQLLTTETKNELFTTHLTIPNS